LVGLLASNTLITFGSAFGFVTASKNWTLYVTVAVLTASASLIIGTLFLLGKGAVLPALFGGQGSPRGAARFLAVGAQAADREMREIGFEAVVLLDQPDQRV